MRKEIHLPSMKNAGLSTYDYSNGDCPAYREELKDKIVFAPLLAVMYLVILMFLPLMILSDRMEEI